VAFDPADSNTFYIGSPAGSTWKTTDGGNTWASLYDFLPTLGVADIKINPLDRNTIFVATGDGDGSDTYSSGVIVSHDGGATWSTTGVNWAPTAYETAHSILINPQDTATIILGASSGIFISHNSGASFVNVFAGNFGQVIYNPADTNIIYGSMYTDTSSQIMRSADGGNTWVSVTHFTDVQRVNLAVCPANPAIVKALASSNTSRNSSGLEGVYSSSDSGQTYTALFTDDTSCTHDILDWDLGLPTANCGGQGWYDLCIAIDPANPLQVSIGGVNSYYSQDGGTTWQLETQWWGGDSGVVVVHADKHCLAYHPLTGALFMTCDGGVYKNYGPLVQPWTDLTNGIGNTEFYRCAVDNDVPFVIAGAQDNGTKMINGAVYSDLTGGDGMQPLINHGDPSNIFYCSYPSGSIDMTRDGGANYHNITDTIHSGGAWVSPYLLNPFDTANILLAYTQVFSTDNNGISWAPISPVFDSNSDIDVLVMAPTNPNYIYAVYDDYNVWKSVIHYTTNGGATWDTIFVPINDYVFITDLVVDPKNEGHFWVTVGGYSSGDKVWSYNLATSLWSNQGGSLPNLPVDCMVIDTSSGTQYLGTDAAVFYRDTAMTNWALYNNHLPTVHIDDLHINYTTGQLWAATFGRGMWNTTKRDVPNSVTQVRALAESVTLSPNPCHGSFVINTTGNNLRNGAVTVKLIASDGRVALEIAGKFDTGGNLKIMTNGLAAGFYICEVSNDAVSARNKVVIY
jgi:photosystem II stability/assembly factor-like uncharacterized protein